MTSAGLSRAIAAALDARTRLRGRPVAETARALAEAGRRWAADGDLTARLIESSGLHPSMLSEILPLVASMLNREAMLELVEQEGNGEGPAPEWIAQVLASNVPALAVPAIALACLAGTVVVAKSGHRDAASGPAFQRALVTVDPLLAATVVPVAWPHSPVLDAVLLGAPLVVLTGHDATVAALATRAAGRVLANGTRVSALVVDTGAPLDPAAAARDVVLYEQRGCLSPHVAFVIGDAAGFARALAAELAAVARRLPPATANVEERAAVRAFLDEATWSGATVEAGAWGAVVLESTPAFRPTCGARTIRVVPLRDAADLPALLPPHAIECLGTNTPLPSDVCAQGVARICPLGRMQQPPLSWPRGQRPALGSLLGASEAVLMAVE